MRKISGEFDNFVLKMMAAMEIGLHTRPNGNEACRSIRAETLFFAIEIESNVILLCETVYREIVMYLRRTLCAHSICLRFFFLLTRDQAFRRIHNLYAIAVFVPTDSGCDVVSFFVLSSSLRMGSEEGTQQMQIYCCR